MTNSDQHRTQTRIDNTGRITIITGPETATPPQQQRSQTGAFQTEIGPDGRIRLVSENDVPSLPPAQFWYATNTAYWITNLSVTAIIAWQSFVLSDDYISQTYTSSDVAYEAFRSIGPVAAALCAFVALFLYSFRYTTTDRHTAGEYILAPLASAAGALAGVVGVGLAILLIYIAIVLIVAAVVIGVLLLFGLGG